ncbi:MAG: hypothetical protein ABH859_02560 [Pseudomonadota bacterium]
MPKIADNLNMGDGQVTRFALIINGDTEDRHRENVDLAINVLNSDNTDQDYQIFVASTHEQQPENIDRFLAPTEANISILIQEIENQMDDDDELVIYITGHGDQDGRVCLPSGCNSTLLNRILDMGVRENAEPNYGQRTIIMDQCYGGNWRNIFLDDPRTLFIAAGQAGDQTCCNNFAPYFWAANVDDQNNDGLISWQERYAHVHNAGGDLTAAQFLSSANYIQPGQAPFETNLVHLRENMELPGARRQEQMEAELNVQLSQLQPGQYAIVAFSLSDGSCEGCTDFEPQLQEQVNQAHGQYLFIQYDSWETPERFSEYANVRPMLAAVDYQGNIYPILDRTNIIAEMSNWSLSFEQRWDLALRDLNSNNIDNCITGLSQILYLAEKREFRQFINTEQHLSLLRQIRNFFQHEDGEIGRRAIITYTNLFELLEPSPRRTLELVQAASLIAQISRDRSLNQATGMIASSYFLSIFNNRTIRNELSSMDRLIDHPNPNIREAVAWAYPFLVNGLPFTSLRTPYARRMRREFNQADEAGLITRLLIYSRIDFSSTIESHQGAPILRSYIRHSNPEVNNAAIKAYAQRISSIRNENERRMGIRALMSSLQQPNPNRSVQATLSAFQGLSNLRSEMTNRDLVEYLGRLVTFMNSNQVNSLDYDELAYYRLRTAIMEIEGRNIPPSRTLSIIFRRAIQTLESYSFEHVSEEREQFFYSETYEDALSYYINHLISSPEEAIRANSFFMEEISQHSFSGQLLEFIPQIYASFIEQHGDIPEIRDRLERTIGILSYGLLYPNTRPRFVLSPNCFARLLIQLEDDRLTLFLINLIRTDVAETRETLAELNTLAPQRIQRLVNNL